MDWGNYKKIPSLESEDRKAFDPKKKPGESNSDFAGRINTFLDDLSNDLISLSVWEIQTLLESCLKSFVSSLEQTAQPRRNPNYPKRSHMHLKDGNRIWFIQTLMRLKKVAEQHKVTSLSGKIWEDVWKLLWNFEFRSFTTVDEFVAYIKSIKKMDYIRFNLLLESIFNLQKSPNIQKAELILELFWRDDIQSLAWTESNFQLLAKFLHNLKDREKTLALKVQFNSLPLIQKYRRKWDGTKDDPWNRLYHERMSAASEARWFGVSNLWNVRWRM